MNRGKPAGRNTIFNQTELPGNTGLFYQCLEKGLNGTFSTKPYCHICNHTQTLTLMWPFYKPIIRFCQYIASYVIPSQRMKFLTPLYRWGFLLPTLLSSSPNWEEQSKLLKQRWTDKQQVRFSWNDAHSLIPLACYSLCCYFVIHTLWGQNHENKPK